jgi:hypothetical protein
MKTLTKVGLSALAGALAVTSANAGEMSISGSMVASYSKGSGYHTTGNPLAMDKELSVTGSGDMDNAFASTVSYKQTITDAMAFNDSEIVFGDVLGTTATLAMTSAGDPMSAIDDVTPTAFEEANAITGSIKDVNGIDGTYSLRLTQADLLGTGFTVDAAYTWEHGSGDAGTEKGSSGVDADGSEDGYSIVVKGSVPMVEGLDVGVGYTMLNTKALTTGDRDQEEGTAYIKYSSGPVSVGYQKGAVSVEGTAENIYVNEYIGLSYKINDDISVSYNEAESRKTADTGADIVQEWDSISLSYTAGGMTLGIVDQEVDNATYTSGRTSEETAFQMTIAF